MTITWAEFKKAVEEQGVTDNHQLDYIDISMAWSNGLENLQVVIEDNLFHVTG